MQVAVVGAGIAGLVLAQRLREADITPIVIEAADQVGGQVRTRNLWGQTVDVGAEAVHLASPAVARWFDQLGLGERVVPANPGTSLLLTRRGLKPLPAGVGPVGPTRIGPVLRSGILSPAGLVRAGLEPLLAPWQRIEGDVSVGRFVRSRFGDEVAEQFVEPMLGNLHGGAIDRLSLLSTARQLVPAAREGRSLLPRPRLPRPHTPTGRTQPGHAFASLPGGLTEFARALAGGLEVRLGQPVRAITPAAAGWTIHTAGQTLTVDALALACPAAVAADLLAPHAAAAAEALRVGRTADVATVVLAYPRTDDELLNANGLLLRARDGHLVKAMTNLDRKWPHMHHPDLRIIRASVGRVGEGRLATLDDHDLVARVVHELHTIAGLPAAHAEAHVERWPGAMPQLEVGHAERLLAVRHALADLPPVVLAGAPYDGIGVSSAIASGEARADDLVTALHEPSESRQHVHH
ncbi:protoporphyrinogen oxidase [Propionibacteriaceae bacterium G1746]|uniref:protoporphyrinogen oxidase n=1 Tax=Aestuariimicrobium sp. G57 TaxID=3418485 RepID=UPI003C2A7837